MALDPKQPRPSRREIIREEAKRAAGEAVRKLVPAVAEAAPAAMPGEPVYRSALAWSAEDKARTLVIACSSSQFLRHCQNFLAQGLNVMDYDLLAVPGGAQWLALPDILPKHNKVARWVIEFLVKKHHLDRVVCIAHQGCSAYQESGTLASLARVVSRKSALEHQLDHLREAGRVMTESLGVPAELYYASISNGAVVFHKVE